MNAAAPAPSARRRAPAWVLALWALAVAAAIGVVATARYSTDMSAFLPQNPSAEQQLLVDQIKDGALSRMLLMGIEGGTPGQRAEASRALAAWMRTSGAFDGVVNGDADSSARDQALLLAQRYALSPQVHEQRFSADGLRGAIGHSVDELGSAAGLMLKALLPRDPTGELLALLQGMAAGVQPHTQDGVLAAADGSRALLMALTRAAGGDLDAQQRTLDTLRDTFERLPAAQGLRLQMSGTPVFSVQARAVIKRDVERLSLIGTLTVVGLLLLVYRSPVTVLIGLLPVASGVLVAIATVALGFGTVHAITIGFGTTLIGESIDYSIYYMVQARDADQWATRFWPTIRLGVLTSLCGFAALVLSSFPGLAQLGAYSIAGLVAAALVTRFVLPALPVPLVPLARLLRLGHLLARAVRALRRLRPLLLALTLAAIGVLVLAPQPIWSKGLTALNPAPRDLQALDARLRADVGAPDLRYLLVATASTQEAALQQAERIEQALQPLIAQGRIGGVESPARFLPSQATQTARRAALPPPEVLRPRLEAALTELPLRAERLAPFIDDVAAARQAPPITVDTLAGTSFDFAVRSLLLKRERGWAALLPVRPAAATQPGQAPELDAAALRQVIDGLRVAPGAQNDADGQLFFLDLEQQTGDMFGAYLTQAWGLVIAGALAVLALLAWNLRSLRRLWRVSLPVAAAVLWVMAGHALAGRPLTLLHLVGLLLIVAVGSNYALFFDRGIGDDADASSGTPDANATALASLALANVSTMIGFGVLAFSEVPVLQALGATVGPGALLALLLSIVGSRRAPDVAPA